VEKPRAETPISENEIRVTTQGKMRNYITYATTLLQDKGASEIVLKAMGRAINKTVTIAEIIKRRIASLHQNTAIGSTDITDLWEPLEEGLLPLETTRHVSMITITLSTKELDTTSTGYTSWHKSSTHFICHNLLVCFSYRDKARSFQVHLDGHLVGCPRLLIIG
jgi:DNA-binding protein Alba